MPPASAPHGSSRRLPTLLLTLAAALLVARIGTGIWERDHPATGHDFVNWRPIAVAEAEARRSGRPVLYEFGAAWCGPCEVMAVEVFQDERSASALNALVVPVQVVDRLREDGRNPLEVEALEQRFAVEAFPTIVLVDPRSGRHETITGYAGRETFLREIASLAGRLTTGAGTDSLGSTRGR